MGACYNTTLIPPVPRDATISALASALGMLDQRVVHREDPCPSLGDFQYRSSKAIFVGPPNASTWLPIVTWENGLSILFPDGYRKSPLALALSHSFSPVLNYFSYNSGQIAGYSIFSDGRHVEAQTVAFQSDFPLGEFTSPLPHPDAPSRLARMLGDVDFEYEPFIRSFSSLEIGTAALAARLGVCVHLTDALDIQDGDGAIILHNGEYRSVSLPDWMAVYYESRVT